MFWSPIPVWGGAVPTTASNFWTSAGYPTIQLNSDTIYLDITSDFTDWGFSPTKMFLISATTTNPGCHLGFWPADYRCKVPISPSLSLINLLEQLIELRETFYLLGLSLYYKRIQRSAELPCPLWACHSPLHMFSNLSFGLNSTSSPFPLPHPPSQGGGTESSIPLITWLTPLATSPQPEVTLKVTHYHSRRHSYCFQYLGNFNGFRNFVLECSWRANMYFLL